MTNKLQEQCSCLIDGELEESECCVILDKICDKPELKQDLHRYYLIRDAIRTNLPGVVNPNFTQSVMDALEAEPTLLAPRVAPRQTPSLTTDSAKVLSFESTTGNDNHVSHIRFYKRAASFAIAASVATIAVFTFSSTNNINQTSEQLAQMPDSSEFIRLSKSKTAEVNSVNTLPSNPQQTENMLVSQPIRSMPLPTKSPIVGPNLQIQRYIINHNQHISSSRLQSVMPYARIVVTKTNNQKPVQEQVQQ
jgi:negative regulator of sigma E activity